VGTAAPTIDRHIVYVSGKQEIIFNNIKLKSLFIDVFFLQRSLKVFENSELP
jgi:hypothetical protein